MSNNLNLSSFTKPSDDPPLTLSIDEFVRKLELHEGFFVVDGKEYDNLLYTGNDNLYFSYCFNFKTGRAVIETLLIIDNILEYPSQFVVISRGKEYSVFLKE